MYIRRSTGRVIPLDEPIGHENIKLLCELRKANGRMKQSGWARCLICGRRTEKLTL